MYLTVVNLQIKSSKKHLRLTSPMSSKVDPWWSTIHFKLWLYSSMADL